MINSLIRWTRNLRNLRKLNETRHEKREKSFFHQQTGKVRKARGCGTASDVTELGTVKRAIEEADILTDGQSK